MNTLYSACSPSVNSLNQEQTFTDGTSFQVRDMGAHGNIARCACNCIVPGMMCTGFKYIIFAYNRCANSLKLQA